MFTNRVILAHGSHTDHPAIVTQIEQEQTAARLDLDARIEAEFLAARKNPAGRQVLPFADENNRACPTCSQVSLAGDLYCWTCGTRLAPACPECGQANTLTDHFCVGCGSELALAVAG